MGAVASYGTCLRQLTTAPAASIQFVSAAAVSSQRQRTMPIATRAPTAAAARRPDSGYSSTDVGSRGTPVAWCGGKEDFNRPTIGRL